jgi:hypothetical protein
MVRYLMILSPAEIRTLTGRVQRAAQMRELRALGVAYRQRTDGSIVVFRRDVDEPAKEAQSPPPALRLPAPRGVLPSAPGRVDAPRLRTTAGAR